VVTNAVLPTPYNNTLLYNYWDMGLIFGRHGGLNNGTLFDLGNRCPLASTALFLTYLIMYVSMHGPN
jgi:hypothetical protein